jgi:hypothetical protein
MSSPKTTKAKGSPKSAKTRRRKPSAAAIRTARLGAVARTLERHDAGWAIMQAIREMVIPCREIEKHLGAASRILDGDEWSLYAQWEIHAAAQLAKPMLKGRMREFSKRALEKPTWRGCSNTDPIHAAHDELLRERVAAIREATGCSP